MNLTDKQQEFLELARQGRNIYLSGKAGTGKSTVVKQLVKEAESVVCLGTSGVAAMNIQGQTLHSFFGLSFGKIFSRKEVKSIRKSTPVELSKTIIIDEVSMLRSDVLENVMHAMEKSRINWREKQFIFVGDLAQLPPITTPFEDMELENLYGGTEFYHSSFFKELNVVHIDLDEIVRQSDSEFIEALNIVRNGGKSEYFRRFVSEDVEGIVLAPHNETVAKYNREGLSKIKGEVHTFYADSWGSAKAEDFNVQEVLKLKEGALIMYLVNDLERGLVNGTLGTFCFDKKPVKKYRYQPYSNKTRKVEYFQVENVPCIKLEDGSTEHIKEYKFEKFIYNDDLEKEIVGTVRALPIRLAFALSIHKSQGLTFDKVSVDLSRPCFQKGQMYTALSRVKTPEGLKIIVK